MTVYFIGAGPGAPDLITVRGLKLIQRCPVCLFAGSLVPEAIVAEAPEGALVKDTAAMNLDEIIEDIRLAHEENKDVARVHSGDPSIYGATAEQMRRLEDLDIEYEVVPGVPAFAAAAAALGTELTVPGIAQTIILTRTAMKSSSMPERESLEILGKAGATMAIHLSVRNAAHIERELTPHYGTDCPAVIAYRVGWPDQTFIHATLGTIKEKIREAKLTRTALILVGPALGARKFEDSKLYDADFSHILRIAANEKG
ncbi:precorrin-4 C(11)-methyltransferase [uncultured Cohaesibacter sp.]|uniref:precorrin-4 C(11)-methyltransferase n=1 Tax=uncultured Cohaesibacter sp. TaxID=1002546 RepID=UPI00292E8A65|nr:precorrin-4 C(11)-methyltransferase [uncultured Cohaesibacter sp.]